jgi:hypothetical protein
MFIVQATREPIARSQVPKLLAREGHSGTRRGSASRGYRWCSTVAVEVLLVGDAALLLNDFDLASGIEDNDSRSRSSPSPSHAQRRSSVPVT